MDCRTCQPTLLDLAYGELAPELAVVTRAHLEHCASCTASFTQLTAAIGHAGRLELLEPPVDLTVEVMQLARNRALERAQAREAAATRDAGTWRGGPGLASRVGQRP